MEGSSSSTTTDVTTPADDSDKLDAAALSEKNDLASDVASRTRAIMGYTQDTPSGSQPACIIDAPASMVTKRADATSTDESSSESLGVEKATTSMARKRAILYTKNMDESFSKKAAPDEKATISMVTKRAIRYTNSMDESSGREKEATTVAAPASRVTKRAIRYTISMDESSARDEKATTVAAPDSIVRKRAIRYTHSMDESSVRDERAATVTAPASMVTERAIRYSTDESTVRDEATIVAAPASTPTEEAAASTPDPLPGAYAADGLGQRLIRRMDSARSSSLGGITADDISSHSGATSHERDDSLVEAVPVGDDNERPDIEAAQPFDVEEADRERSERSNQLSIIAFRLGVVAFLIVILAVSLAAGLTMRTKESTPGATTNKETPLGPGGGSHAPLHFLYEELPEKTKEKINSNAINSPQHQAWEWVLNHPNISSYPEWRKKQLFAMATFFYSFEGPKWPKGRRKRWMDYSRNECTWIANKYELPYFYRLSLYFLGADAYQEQDGQPCNSLGQLQHLLFYRIYLPTTSKPSIPPEISLLTSLKYITNTISELGSETKLSEDLLIPELLELPNLVAVTFRNTGGGGTIPAWIGSMTGGGLRHLVLGGNSDLTGTIPSQIAKLSTTLEFLSISDAPGISGQIPSQIGRMTKLTDLQIQKNSVTGTIPSELGSLTLTKDVYLDSNRLVGRIPSQLGMLTKITWLALYDNSLTGSIPTELGLMSNTQWLRIRNNNFSGLIPSQLGLMNDLIQLRIGNDLTLGGARNNNFSGFLPPELWKLSLMEQLDLSNLSNLSGSIPKDLAMPNLTVLSLGGSPHLSGKLPDQACFVEELDFDCSDALCGCKCPCPVSNENKTIGIGLRRK